MITKAPNFLLQLKAKAIEQTTPLRGPELWQVALSEMWLQIIEFHNDYLS